MVSKAALTPPITLSMEAFRRDWEPEGWKLLVVGPTATWRQDWGEWEAIRDIVQNALDEAESYSWGSSVPPLPPGLSIRDTGRGVQVADFLLGPPKLKPPYARGRFGEGMKIASLALLRKGYAMKVDTIGRELWMVFLEVKVNGEAAQLAALWRSDGIKQGTRFIIVGYMGSAYEDRFAVNLPSEAVLHRGPSPLQEPIKRYNTLISNPSGRIYARDIYLKGINSPFSYNLWGFEMAPDRHGPKSESEMHTDMGRLWCTVNQVDLLKVFLQMVVQPPKILAYESQNMNMGYWDMKAEPVSGKNYQALVAENAAAWREAWSDTMGGDVVLRTAGRLDPMVRHLGYRTADVLWGVQDTLSKAIKTDSTLVAESQEKLTGVKVVPDTQLSPLQQVHLRLARAIVQKVSNIPPSKVHAAIIPPASDRVRTAGMYSREGKEAFISLDQLEHARTTVDTVIHEVAHHTSGAEDLTEPHSSEMTSTAARVVEFTADGAFNTELEGAIW